MAATEKFWLGSPIEKCDLCHRRMDKLACFYDANVPGESWGNICHGCFTAHRCKLGTGLGQKYSRQPDGKWLKTGG